MEAIPRLHMLWFPMKQSPVGTSFGKLKQFIAHYDSILPEDPDQYLKEVAALEALRAQAVRDTKDSCSILKRYYCQLHYLQNHFPQIKETKIFTFTWKDLYQSHVNEYTALRCELATILFNIGASHTQVGASVNRGDVDVMKLACTHFQCAAWAFGELRDRYGGSSTAHMDVMVNELLIFMQQISYAQAQECILEKSLIDNRKPNIVAKVTAQIIVYYGDALTALLTGGDEGPIAQVVEISVYKMWKKYVRFKISYLNCILFLYRGQHAEEQQKMGERVTLYQAAWDKLEEARKESKGLPDYKEIQEALIFAADVVEAKRKNAKNENEFIYHESVPELSSISALQGANLVNGISFSVTDTEVAGEDIFGRLIPLRAHEASSVYSEEKAKLLRKYGALIEEKDTELTKFMSSLNLENLNISEEKANKIPQGIVDRCAALNANKNAIPDLISAMGQLAEICADVEMSLKEISAILSEENDQERRFQTLAGLKRTPNAHITELMREYQKYIEAHVRAGESNDTLRKAMELHVNNLKILTRPLSEIQKCIPKLNGELNTAEIFKDVRLILNKINEMKAQRAQFHADLRIALKEDDITAKIILQGIAESVYSLFATELKKHDQLTQLIDQNLLAQKNILHALTDAYAKTAPVLKSLADLKNKREYFFSLLAASYDVYEDLLEKSAKGLEFYKKLSGNVQKLLTRLKSARDVQSEERQQRLKNVTSNNNAGISSDKNASTLPTVNSTNSATPKLRDYLNSMSTSTGSDQNFMGTTPFISTSYNPPAVRPNPLGSEAPSESICSNVVSPDEPPPPYSLQQASYYDYSYMSGYTNPIYQQHISPPAYKLQASPSSQFQQESNSMENYTINGGIYSQTPNNPATISHQDQPTIPARVFQQQQQFNNMEDRQQNQAPLQYQVSNFPDVNSAIYPRPGMSTNQRNAYSENMYEMPIYQQYETPCNPTTGAHAVQNYQNQNATINENAGIQNFSLNAQPSVFAQLPVSKYVEHNTMPPSGPNPCITQSLGVVTSGSETSSSNIRYSTSQPCQFSNDTIPQNQANVTIPFNILPQQPKTGKGPSVAQNANISQTPIADPNARVMGDDSLSGDRRLQQTEQPPAIPNLYSVVNKAPGIQPSYNYITDSNVYENGSGQQRPATVINKEMEGQYTSASVFQESKQPMGITDSISTTDTTLTADYDCPIISHTKCNNNSSVIPADHQAKSPNLSSNISYYSPMYGYNSYDNEQPVNEFQDPHPQLHTSETHPQNNSTNVISAEVVLPTSGTSECALSPPKEANNRHSSTSKQQSDVQKIEQHNAVQNKSKQSNDNFNLDLLSDLDISDIGVPPPILPKLALGPQSSTECFNANIMKDPETTNDGVPSIPTDERTLLPIQSTTQQQQNNIDPSISLINRKLNNDNQSELRPVSDTFECHLTASRTTSGNDSVVGLKHTDNINPVHLNSPCDPLSDDKTLKNFRREVELYERQIENLNVKMLNGHTHLSAKWTELQHILSKEPNKGTTNIAKLFPEKNRSSDCLPYDHSRVKLEKDTDDYINAAFVNDLGAGCPNIIIAQTPLPNTVVDFWSMVWAQKSCTILCLHTPNEMLDPFWPQHTNEKSHYEDFTVICIKVNSSLHCIEYHLQLTLQSAAPAIDVSILQIKSWKKSSPIEITGIAEDTVKAYQFKCFECKTPTSPLIICCLTGSERSELMAVAICAVLGPQSSRPTLINVVDVWRRICSQRQNALRDSVILEQSMQIVLHHAHNLLNKHGIMTSYQMKVEPQLKNKQKEEIRDPLNELDPLWKLK